MPQQARIRQPVACLPCREKKVKCDGLRPCAYCKKHDWECIFPSRSRKRTQVTNDQDVSKRLARVEALLGTENVRSSIHPETGSAAPTNYGQGSVLSPVSDHRQTIQWTERSSRLYGNCIRSEDQPSRLSPVSNAVPVAWKQPTEASISVDSGRIDSPSDHESGIIEKNTTHEYHGAGSMLSVFSKLGSEWVYKQTGVSEFESMARSLASQIVSWLKLTQRIPEERVTEPDRDMALELSSAYFEDNEISNGILHQPSFELRLRRFFDTPDSSSADPGWYALRNTIYAGGKRKMLKDAGMLDFNDVHSRAFPYFANA